MSEFAEIIAQVELLKVNLENNFKEFQIALENLNTSRGKVNLAQLTGDLQQKANDRDKFVATTISSLVGFHERFVATIKDWRQKGFAFDDEITDVSFAELNNTDETSIINTLDNFLRGMKLLDARLEDHKILQAQVARQLEILEKDYKKLEEFEVLKSTDQVAYNEIKLICKDLSFPLETIHQKIKVQVEIWGKKIKEIYEIRIVSAKDVLVGAVKRLEILDGMTDEYRAMVKELEILKDANQFDELLTRLQETIVQFTDFADQLNLRKSEEIKGLVSQARGILNELHPAMEEAILLRSTLEDGKEAKEDQLISYAKSLIEGIELAQNSGLAAIEQFKFKFESDPNYVISKLEESEILGTAVNLLADREEFYGSSLWSIAAEVMIRSELGGMLEMDAKVFYSRYGYSAINKAFQSAANKRDFFSLLSLFESQFSPPDFMFNVAGIEHLLTHDLVSNSFKRLVTSNALRIDQNKYLNLSMSHYVVMLNIIVLSQELELPMNIQLQWVAVLIDSFPVKSKEQEKAASLLVDTLLNFGQYVSLYYSLVALGQDYPYLWLEPKFRPMIFHIINHVFSLGLNDTSFLIDVLINSQVEKLAAGDFSSEFLLGSLAHYLATQKNEMALLNIAWNIWDKFEVDYPCVIEVLKKNLEGESFSFEVSEEIKRLNDEYDKLIQELKSRMSIPSSNHPFVYHAHNWYVTEYFSKWIKILEAKSSTVEQFESVSVLLRKIRGEKNLLELSEPDYKVKSGQKGSNILPGSLRNKENSRLVDTIGRFEKALNIKKKIFTASKEEGRMTLPPELKGELLQITQQAASVNWAVGHLLKPGLPFIDGMLNI